MTPGVVYVALSVAGVALLTAAVITIGLIDAWAGVREDYTRDHGEVSNAEWDEIVGEALAFARLKAEIRADGARKSDYPPLLCSDAEQTDAA